MSFTSYMSELGAMDLVLFYFSFSFSFSLFLVIDKKKDMWHHRSVMVTIILYSHDIKKGVEGSGTRWSHITWQWYVGFIDKALLWTKVLRVGQ